MVDEVAEDTAVEAAPTPHHPHPQEDTSVMAVMACLPTL